MRNAGFAFYLLIVVIATAQTYPDQGGAQINQPIQRNITGAVCFSGTGKLEGNAFFHFPNQNKTILSFTLGPAAQGQEKNDSFTGAGIYDNIVITIKPETGNAFSGVGQVIVNDDVRRGAFSFKTAATNNDDDDDDDEKPTEAVASGTWDCGRALKH
jgi:hypothetical protein